MIAYAAPTDRANDTLTADRVAFWRGYLAEAEAKFAETGDTHWRDRARFYAQQIEFWERTDV